jgi:hypothetical protein
MGAIDGMLGDLHLVRSQLADEIRASGDASAARADRLPGGAEGGDR